MLKPQTWQTLYNDTEPKERLLSVFFFRLIGTSAKGSYSNCLNDDNVFRRKGFLLISTTLPLTQKFAVLSSPRSKPRSIMNNNLVTIRAFLRRNRLTDVVKTYSGYLLDTST